MGKKRKKGRAGIKEDNRGTSLTELLVAFAVSAVVLSGIAYILIISLQLSGKNNAGAEVQSEIQTTINLLLDGIMEAEGICMQTALPGGSTDCFLMGEIDIRKEGSNFVFYYKGNALVADYTGGSGTLYLAEFPNEVYTENADGYCKLGTGGTENESILDAMGKTKSYVMGLSAEERLRYLLGRDITSCVIRPEFEYGEKTITERGTAVTKQYFEEPLTFSVMLHVESNYGDGTVERELTDQVAVRSRIDRIYLTKKGAASADVMEIYERNQ